jgi:hypothetical protein
VFGSKQKAGVVYRNFACSANRTKGVEMCPSCSQYSELKLLTAIAEAVRVSIGHPELISRFLESFERYWSVQTKARTSSSASDALRAAIRSLEAKHGNIIRAIEQGADSFGGFVDRLRELDAQLRTLRQRLGASLEAKGERQAAAVTKPSREQLLAALGGLDDVLRGAPAEANAALAARLTDVVVTPRAAGSGFSLDFALKTKPAALVGAAGLGSEVSGNRWLRGQDLNLRPSGYEPYELPGCSTPRQVGKASK